MRIAAAQTPALRESVEGAMDCAIATIAEARREGASLVLFPECFLQGYLTDAEAARRAAIDLRSPDFRSLAARLDGVPHVVMGLIERDGDRLYNTAVVIRAGRLAGVYRKIHLLRGESVFTAGHAQPVFEIGGLRAGIAICYDTNFAQTLKRLVHQRASLILCPSNNMMPQQRALEMQTVHNAVRAKRCRETGLWLLSADVTGGGDGRLALGPTALIDPAGTVVAQLPKGKTGLLVCDLPFPDPGQF